MTTGCCLGEGIARALINKSRRLSAELYLPVSGFLPALLTLQS